MSRRGLAWLTGGLVMWAAGCAASAAVTVLDDLHHPAPGWIAVPLSLVLGLGFVFVRQAFDPTYRV